MRGRFLKSKDHSVEAPSVSADLSFYRHLLRKGILQPPPLGLFGRKQVANLAQEGNEAAVLAEAAQYFGASYADLERQRPDPLAIRQLGALHCLKDYLLPLTPSGAVTYVATARPEAFLRQRADLEAALGPVAMLLAPSQAIEAKILSLFGPELAHRAETSVPPHESCRDWNGPALPFWAGSLTLGLLALATLAPDLMLLATILAAVFLMIANTALKLSAVLACLGARAEPEQNIEIAHLPKVSILIGLYRESDIAGRLVRRLSRLDYPTEKLEICLAVEAEDGLTQSALARSALPPWMRVVVVPKGQVMTKPRALNHALALCQGTIIGVYDAEDAPAPEQIRKVVEKFYSSGPDLACVQGVLDYYNPYTNWMSRCFSIEYTAWFRLILPGVARLGLVVPLGGTTLFFRREILETLGAWDAHNVTEDADLGVRLARHGYRTALISSVTREEANCRLLPWIKQRSRWIKGYMMTWLTHMRAPNLLWQELGPKRFLGFQLQFLGSILQALLAPVLWLFWLTAGDISGLPPMVTTTAVLLCVIAFGLDLVIGLLTLRRADHRFNPLWLCATYFYYPLATCAAYKALWEVIRRPFYWDKTSHGHFDIARKGPPPASAASAPPPRHATASRRHG